MGAGPSRASPGSADFFHTEYSPGSFDVIVGNPDYGGTFDPAIEDKLDALYGRWHGHKPKKGTTRSSSPAPLTGSPLKGPSASSPATPS